MQSFLGIDIGTSSVKAVLLSAAQDLIAEAGAPLDVSRPRPLYSEQDPEAWWRALGQAIAALRAQAPEAWAGLSGIGLSGQQHGATLLDDRGEVLRPCILWNDGRAFAECAELTRRAPDFTARAGNIAMPGFTAPKLLWVAKHEPDIFRRTAKILLPKDYVRFRLSGAAISDLSDSSGTLWLDISRRAFDETLLAACDLRLAQMPELVEGAAFSAFLSQNIAADWGLAGRRIPIAGGGGDNAASAIGIGAIGTGDGFVSLGTSGVIFVSSDQPVMLPERTLHGFCHALPERWHGMAVVLSAAASLNWIAGLLGGDVPSRIGAAEQASTDVAWRARAPIFLPYLTGERTPHNDPTATAHFAGLTIEHDAAALVYGVLEGVAFALADGLDVLREAGAPPRACMLVGGGARSAFWAQLIADATGLALDLPRGAELGAAFGAARLGMLAAGHGGIAEICAKPTIAKSFSPNPALAPILMERRARMQRLYRPVAS